MDRQAREQRREHLLKQTAKLTDPFLLGGFVLGVICLIPTLFHVFVYWDGFPWWLAAPGSVILAIFGSMSVGLWAGGMTGMVVQVILDRLIDWRYSDVRPPEPAPPRRLTFDSEGNPVWLP